MTAEEYKSALITLDISHEAVAERLGIGVRSSYRYAREGGVPKPVSMMLAILLDAQKRRHKRRRSALSAHDPVAAE